MPTDERYFVSAVNLDWHNAGNWAATDGGGAGVGVPTGDSNVYLTNVSSNNICNLSANAACLSLTIGKVGNLYAGTLDAVTFDIAIGTGGFNGTYGGSATVRCGIGNGTPSEWTCSGDFNNKDIGTWFEEESHVVLTGTAKSITGHNAKPFNNLTFLNGSEITVVSATDQRVVARGTLTIDGEVTLDDVLAVTANGDMVIEANAVIGGSSFLYSLQSASGHGITSVHGDATIGCAVWFNAAVAGTKCASPLTISGQFVMNADGAGNNLLQLDAAGTYNFGSIRFDSNGTGLITLDNAANDPASITCGDLTFDMAGTGNTLVDGTLASTNWTITGDVIQIEGSSGRLTWIAGSGDMTLSGNDSVNIDFNGQTTESVTITKAGTGIIDLQSGDFELGANSSMYGLAISGDTDFDAFVSDVAIGAGGLDCSSGSGATISQGSGTWTITGGTFDYEDIGNFNDDTSTIVFVGTCSWIAKSATQVRTVHIVDGGTTTVTGGSLTVVVLLAVGNDATLLINTFVTISGGELTTGTDSRVGGTTRLQMFSIGAGDGYTSRGAGTTFDVADFWFLPEATSPDLPAGVYSSDVMIYNDRAGVDALLTLSAGSYAFDSLELESSDDTGPLTLEVGAATDITVGGTLLIDLNNAADITVVGTNGSGDCNWILQGDVDTTSEVSGGGSFNWTPGTGTITLNDTNAQAVDFGGLTVEAITINKASETVTLGGNVTTASFTGTAGTLDPAGKTLTTTGNMALASAFDFAAAADTMNGCSIIVGGGLTLDGQTMNATAVWTLSVAGTAIASRKGSVEYCNSAGGTEINALKWVDGDNNVNWLFSTTDINSAGAWSAVIALAAGTWEVKDYTAGQQILVTGYSITPDAASTVTFKSGVTPISGAMVLANAGDTVTAKNVAPVGLMVCGAGESLNITTTAAINGHISGVLM